MYRLGASSVENTIYRFADFDFRNNLLSPSSQVPVRQNSGSDDILGGSIYDPARYSAIFEDVKDNRHAYWVLYLLTICIRHSSCSLAIAISSVQMNI